jgi:hypothetical protein
MQIPTCLEKQRFSSRLTAFKLESEVNCINNQTCTGTGVTNMETELQLKQ